MTHYLGECMLYTLAIIMLLLWAVGLVTATTLGGFIHVLLVIAVAFVLLRIIRGNRGL
ncbi:MAG: lmo0937 family membrane protein [Aeromonas sp.]